MLGVTTREGVRVLGARDLPAIYAVLAADPYVNVFSEAHIREAGPRLGGLDAGLWGYDDPSGRLSALCYAGANLVPTAASPEAIEAFGKMARRFGRRCSSLWGRREVVEPMWLRVASAWGRPRAIRAAQPFLTLHEGPSVRPDALVRRVRRTEVDAVYRASVAFFTEELGVSPERRGGAAQYRRRVEELVRRGRCYARFEGDEIVFKAEIGVATPRAFQIQGVWVHPARRGRGLAAPGVAAVAMAGMRTLAPVATLYVNDFNEAARRTYARVGFREHATFMTVLL